ncbi:hypothetical protein [Hugenholtzia roseola]|uniref:hypothetical protein n=1 Tax=Hugenholtzia roseola TaxID=1002 RepID=UPI000417961B|nr:hypothetical protein [Hugenholtzia roseola]
MNDPIEDKQQPLSESTQAKQWQNASDDKKRPLTDTEMPLVEKKSPESEKEPNLVQDMQFERDKQTQNPANKSLSPPILDNNSPLCKVMNDFSHSLDPQNALPPSLQEIEQDALAHLNAEAQTDFAATELEAFYTQEDIKAEEEAIKEAFDLTRDFEETTTKEEHTDDQPQQVQTEHTNNYTPPHIQNPIGMTSLTENIAPTFEDTAQETPSNADSADMADTTTTPTHTPEFTKTNYWLALLFGTLTIFLTAYLWGKATMWVDEHRNAYMALPIGLLVGAVVRISGRNYNWKLGAMSVLLVLIGCFLGNVLSAVEPLAVSFKMSYVEIFQIFDFSHVWGFLKDRFIPIDTLYYSVALALGFLIPFFSWKRK